jgi:tetratricopeptide (TPR) repeat protein
MKHFILSMLFAVSVLAAKPDISVQLEPKQIALDESAQLTVTVSGALGNEGALPDVEGLEFTPAGRSSRFQSINGEVTESQSLIYLVRATRAGTFTIPALKVGNGRDAVSSGPVVLRVTGSGSTPAPRVRDDSNVSANGHMAFLRLVAPKRELYVGELVPVEIKAYFRAGVGATLNGLPRLNSDAFTMSRPDNRPVQTQEIVDGQPYVVLTWTTALSAVKAGEYALGLELPVLVQVQERSRAPRGFFDDFFGRVVEKPVTLKTDSDAAKILPLPAESRPADFTGAVGQFEIAAEASPAHVTAGDPITLRLKVTGAGNFDRVSASMLTGTDWKTYKPVARFEPADSAGYQGTKTFEQAVVPSQAGKREIPALTFSYFDPETRQYVTRAAQPLTVEVAGSAVVPAAPPVARAEQPELAPNRIEPGRFVSTLRPLYLQRWFLMANFVALAGIAVAFYSFRHRDRLARHSPLPRASLAGRAITKAVGLFLIGLLVAAETRAGFDEANAAFAEKRYADAASGFEAVIRAHGFSAPVLFNLANAYYLDGKPGRAIVNYERAQRLAPLADDVAVNLSTACRQAGIVEPPAHWLSTDALACLGSLTALLIAAGLLHRQVTGRDNLAWIIANGVALVAVMVALFLRYPERGRAIVVAKSVPVYIAPVTVTQPTFTLSEGQAVTIRKVNGDFLLVEAGDGQRGWITPSAVERVTPM